MLSTTFPCSGSARLPRPHRHYLPISPNATVPRRTSETSSTTAATPSRAHLAGSRRVSEGGQMRDFVCLSSWICAPLGPVSELTN